MSNPFSLTSITDSGRTCVYLKADGDMDSVAFIDGYISAMKVLDEPWRFDRIVDLLSCDGQADFADFVRLWQYWAPLTHRASGQLRTAVVTRDQRTIARMAVLSMLFQGHLIRTFDAMPDAEAWLDASKSAAA